MGLEQGRPRSLIRSILGGVLGMEPRAVCMLSKHCAMESTPSPVSSPLHSDLNNLQNTNFLIADFETIRRHFSTGYHLIS